MLKKFLTTIIVLAATATAWADGWKVDYDINGCHDATITKSADGKMTLADAIADANNHINQWATSEDLKKVQKVIIVAESMTEDEVTALGTITQNHVDLSSAKGLANFPTLPECVKYVILPDGMTKEQVNAVGTSFDAAVSKSAHVAPVGKWTYTNANGDEIMYTGTLTEEDGITTGIVSVNIPLSNPVITYKNGEEVYNGKVFVKDGISYLTTAEPIALTPYSNRYTYSNNGVITLFPETGLVSNNGQLGVINPSEIFQINNVNISYTYVEGDKTYAYNDVPYKVGDKYVKVEGGTEYTTNSETTYTYNNGTSDVPYDVANGFLLKEGIVDYTQGNIGSSKLALTKGVEYTYYEYPNTIVYDGPICFKDGTAYRRLNCSTPIQVSLKWLYVDGNNNSIPSTTPIREDNGKYYALYTNRGYYNELTLDENGNYTLNGEAYTGLVYKSEDKYYASVSGENREQEIYYKELYVDENNKTYPNWDIFEQGENKFVYTDGYNGELTTRDIFVTDNGVKHEGNVYTVDNNEYFGYLDENTEVTLTKNEILYYIVDDTRYNVTEESVISLDKTKVLLECTKITDLTPYNNWNYIVIETNELYTKTVYKYNGNDYGCDDEPIAIAWSNNGYYTDGEVVYANGYIATVTNDEITEYYGTVADAEMIQLSVIYEYTYIHPITGKSLTYTTDVSTVSINEECTVELTYSEVMESIGNIHLTAYVSAPGSLKFALARWKDLGNNNAYAAQVGNVTALTLSGDVNYADIGTTGNTITEYGHVAYTDNGNSVTPEGQGHERNIQNDAPAMDGNALTYLDLENAVFAVQTDMQFAKVNTKLETVILPTHESMFLIPDNAFNNLQQISELCIPYNYTTIGSCAFYNTHSLMHIYTTDNPEDDSDNEATVDNGPNTFTFSANLKQIEGGIGVNSTFFGNHIEDVTDIYVLAEEAPLCGANAFAGSMTYGNSGFAGDLAHPIGRHNYKNGDKWFVVLHYPSELAGTEEEKKYTDVTRVYTLADETGAVDGRGHSMKWPKHVEFGQAYETALEGKLWDGTTAYDTNYQGWHEIVLTGNSPARDFDPQTENTEFVYRDWLTICVPYDMKKSQLLSLLGVAPTKNENGAEGVIYEYVCVRDANGNPVKDTQGNYTFEYKEIKRTNAPLYPDVRALTHVSRSVNSRKMTLHFTKLIEQNEIAALSEGDNNETTVTTHDVAINESHGQGFTKTEQTEDDPVVMKGGHPYLIRAYVPKEWNDQIKNLGMYIMAAASSANHAATEQGIGESELPYQYGNCTVQASGVEMYLPCLMHKVHAFDADSNTEINSVVAKDKHESFSYIDTDKDAPILYHFIGTYTETKIPQYAYYIGKTKEGVHKFSRTTKTGANAFTWAPYTAVIIGLSAPNYDAEAFDDKATGTAGSIDNIIVQPGVTGDDLKIYVGEDEKLGTSGARLSLGGFDDSTVTGIVDVNVNSNVNVSNNKVYSINGQYMGTSLNKLPKGIYIINGQKKVVK